MEAIRAPQQIVSAHGDKISYQLQHDLGGAKIFLPRLIVSDVEDPAIVVTVYQTNKIHWYWRTS